MSEGSKDLPVGGVTVVFNTGAGSEEAVSIPAGDYSVTLSLPEPESVAIHVNHPGYAPFNDIQTFNPGEEHEYDVSLVPE